METVWRIFFSIFNQPNTEMRNNMHKKKVLSIAVALFIMVTLSAITIIALNSEDEYSGAFDWYFDSSLPTAVSTGIEPYQLVSLSNDELRVLHQPYIDITNAISTEFGVRITTGSIDCYFVTREEIIYVISNLSLDKHETAIRDIAQEIRNLQYSAKLYEVLRENGYGHLVSRLLENGYVEDTFEAYYRIQRDGATLFIEEIGVNLE